MLPQLMIPAAYAALATNMMISQANWFLDQIGETNVVKPTVANSQIMVMAPTSTLRGVIKTTNTFLSFVGGKTFSYVRLRRYTDVNSESIFDPINILKYKDMPSILNKQSAKQRALDLLSRVGVNTNALDAAAGGRTCEVTQQEYYDRGLTTNTINQPFTSLVTIDPVTKELNMVPDGPYKLVQLPIFDVEWKNQGDIETKITLFGVTGELLQMDIYNASLITRPPIVVTNSNATAKPDFSPRNRFIKKKPD